MLKQTGRPAQPRVHRGEQRFDPGVLLRHLPEQRQRARHAPRRPLDPWPQDRVLDGVVDSELVFEIGPSRTNPR
ncbi:hypothetical protein Acsp03_32730 [Actinomadura sp. NBRC 104412]|nr:hypothetical protein Acsp03_32730 [Actinomadura sp. NBRC 104412]